MALETTMRSRERRPRNILRMALCAAALAACPAGLAGAQERLERLEREAFDVIPPSERVAGAPGEMQVWQAACRVGPTHWARRRIVDVAAQEWGYFGFQIIDAANAARRFLPAGIVADRVNPELPAPRIETIYLRLGLFDDMRELAATIGGYWSATPDGRAMIAVQNRAWNANPRRDIRWVQPWSAAFVSWVMCEAGIGDTAQFVRDVSHRVYIDQAIRARDGLAPGAAFTAYDAGEAQIEPGDLLCNARGEADYRTLADRRRDTGEFAPLHCDVVVKIDAAAMRIHVIGGNVRESVSLTVLPALREEGRELRPLDESIVDGARTVFAHLKLNADPVEMDALDNSPTIGALSEAVRQNLISRFED